jgi:hypothetical protein
MKNLLLIGKQFKYNTHIAVASYKGAMLRYNN